MGILVLGGWSFELGMIVPFLCKPFDIGGAWGGGLVGRAVCILYVIREHGYLSLIPLTYPLNVDVAALKFMGRCLQFFDGLGSCGLGL